MTNSERRIHQKSLSHNPNNQKERKDVLGVL